MDRKIDQLYIVSKNGCMDIVQDSVCYYLVLNLGLSQVVDLLIMLFYLNNIF